MLPGVALRDAIKNGAASGKPVKPPNLGAAPAGSKRMCANCKWFRSAGVRGGNCRLYGGYRVKAGDVSDSYTPRG